MQLCGNTQVYYMCAGMEVYMKHSAYALQHCRFQVYHAQSVRATAPIVVAVKTA